MGYLFFFVYIGFNQPPHVEWHNLWTPWPVRSFFCHSSYCLLVTHLLLLLRVQASAQSLRNPNCVYSHTARWHQISIWPWPCLQRCKT
jgi:hypothetical protein